jgi:hypothetical protein
MVGVGFAMMIIVEEACGKIGDACNMITGQEEEGDLSPAALVGSFSRYK